MPTTNEKIAAIPENTSCPANLDSLSHPKVGESLPLELLTLAVLPFQAVSHLLQRSLQVSLRLANPISPYKVWSGEVHPSGRSPLRWKNIVPLMTVSTFSWLALAPRDYEPQAGKPSEDAFRAVASDLELEPVAQYCHSILKGVEQLGSPTLSEVQRALPALRGLEEDAIKHGVASGEPLTKDAIIQVVLSHSSFEMTKDEISRQFPHLLDSALFMTAAARGSERFSLLFLLQCEENRKADSVQGMQQEAESILSDAVKAHPVACELYRHKYIGPMIDSIVKKTAEDVVSAHFKGKELTEDQIRATVFRGAREAISEQGASDEVLEEYDRSIREIVIEP